MRIPTLCFFLIAFSIPSMADTNGTDESQAVIVHFSYGSRDLSKLFQLEDKLDKAISAAKAGIYDGNEMATDGSDGFLYMYGPDADRLFAVVKPILEQTPFMKGATVTKQYGPPGEGTREVTLVIQPN